MAKTPESLVQLFRDLMDSVMRTVTLVGVSVGELSRLEKTIVLMDAVHKARVAAYDGGPEGHPADSHIQDLSKALPLVQAQRDNGFPFLHGLATIAIWSELEAYVEDVMTDMLLTHPPTWEAEAIRKIKAPVSEFFQLEGRDRCAWMVQALQKDLAVGYRVGAGQLEPLLRSVGLGGTGDTEIRASLVELWAVRNVLVHRRGRADARFTDCCPWLNITIGQDVLVSKTLLYRYAAAALGYAAETNKRVKALFGDPTDGMDEFLASVAPLAHREKGTT